MPLLTHQRQRLNWFVIIMIAAVLPWASATAQDDTTTTGETLVSENSEPRVHFSFDGTPWRDVANWLADSGDLALHIGELPTGSFTYSDSSSFTPQEAIDRVNLFLLPQGFTLIRSGRLLSVINLGDRRSEQQLNALAKLVTLDQLDQLDDHQVAKCLFPLGEFNADDAVEELSALNLMMIPAVLPKTNQLLLVDTAAKLRMIRSVLNAFEPRVLDNGTMVKSFPLEHAEAEDVLVVARPHLGLATGEMIGIDVSLSADLQGRNIFVTGVEDKVKLIENLIASIDRPDESKATTEGTSELKSYIVQGGNVEIVYDVLQTLLANEDMRLSMDKTAGSIVAFATPQVHAEIEKTVLQLQATEAEFAVIQLKTIDPYLAVSLLEEMLDLPDEEAESTARSSKSKTVDALSPAVIDVPKIDADPVNRRLFVRGRKHQIEQIKKIVTELDTDGSVGSSDEIRILPFRGQQAEQVLETAAKFWKAPNPIFFYPAPESNRIDDVERVLNTEPVSANHMQTAGSGSNVLVSDERPSSAARLMTNNVHSQAPAIRCQLTPRGLLLQCEDTAALDHLESHMRTIGGPGNSMPSPPVVFYLKYTRTDDAIRMLAELLDGGEAAKESEFGSLVNGSTSSSGLFLNSMVTSRDGTITLMAGTITIVADSRLNRLITQGTSTDVERIEAYLKIVDKDNSITSVETYGTSHVIELSYTRASEVADAIREAYGDRVSGDSKSSKGDASVSAAAAAAAVAKAAAAAKAAARTGGSESSGKDSRSLEPKMTIAVHERSNSLIVTAPEQLFKDVEQLARQIDERSKQAVKVITVPDTVPFDLMLQMFSESAVISTDAASAKSSTSSARSTRE